jgi:hypothetical protein
MSISKIPTISLISLIFVCLRCKSVSVMTITNREVSCCSGIEAFHDSQILIYRPGGAGGQVFNRNNQVCGTVTLKKGAAGPPPDGNGRRDE